MQLQAVYIEEVEPYVYLPVAIAIRSEGTQEQSYFYPVTELFQEAWKSQFDVKVVKYNIDKKEYYYPIPRSISDDKLITEISSVGRAVQPKGSMDKSYKASLDYMEDKIHHDTNYKSLKQTAIAYEEIQEDFVKAIVPDKLDDFMAYAKQKQIKKLSTRLKFIVDKESSEAVNILRELNKLSPEKYPLPDNTAPTHQDTAEDVETVEQIEALNSGLDNDARYMPNNIGKDILSSVEPLSNLEKPQELSKIEAEAEFEEAVIAEQIEHDEQNMAEILTETNLFQTDAAIEVDETEPLPIEDEFESGKQDDTQQQDYISTESITLDDFNSMNDEITIETEDDSQEVESESITGENSEIESPEVLSIEENEEEQEQPIEEFITLPEDGCEQPLSLDIDVSDENNASTGIEFGIDLPLGPPIEQNYTPTVDVKPDVVDGAEDIAKESNDDIETEQPAVSNENKESIIDEMNKAEKSKTEVVLQGDIINDEIKNISNKTSKLLDSIRDALDISKKVDEISKRNSQLRESLKKEDKTLLEGEKLLAAFSQKVKEHGAIVDNLPIAGTNKDLKIGRENSVDMTPLLTIPAEEANPQIEMNDKLKREMSTAEISDVLEQIKERDIIAKEQVMKANEVVEEIRNLKTSEYVYDRDKVTYKASELLNKLCEIKENMTKNYNDSRKSTRIPLNKENNGAEVTENESVEDVLASLKAVTGEANIIRTSQKSVSVDSKPVEQVDSTNSDESIKEIDKLLSNLNLEGINTTNKLEQNMFAITEAEDYSTENVNTEEGILTLGQVDNNDNLGFINNNVMDRLASMDSDFDFED